MTKHLYIQRRVQQSSLVTKVQQSSLVTIFPLPGLLQLELHELKIRPPLPSHGLLGLLTQYTVGGRLVLPAPTPAARREALDLTRSSVLVVGEGATADPAILGGGFDKS